MLHNAYKPIRFCTLNKLNRDWRNVAKKTSTSLMSTKLIVFGALFAREILRVDSPVSNIIYVPHVRPPRLPWRKCRDIFVGQHMTRHKKKGPQCDPCLSHPNWFGWSTGNFKCKNWVRGSGNANKVMTNAIHDTLAFLSLLLQANNLTLFTLIMIQGQGDLFSC